MEYSSPDNGSKKHFFFAALHFLYINLILNIYTVLQVIYGNILQDESDFLNVINSLSKQKANILEIIEILLSFRETIS